MKTIKGEAAVNVLFCISEHSSDSTVRKILEDNSNEAYLSEESKNRKTGVEQNTKPQKLCYTGATKVLSTIRI